MPDRSTKPGTELWYWSVTNPSRAPWVTVACRSQKSNTKVGPSAGTERPIVKSCVVVSNLVPPDATASIAVLKSTYQRLDNSLSAESDGLDVVVKPRQQETPSDTGISIAKPDATSTFSRVSEGIWPD